MLFSDTWIGFCPAWSRLSSSQSLSLNLLSNHKPTTTHRNFVGTSRQVRKLIFGMQPNIIQTSRNMGKQIGITWPHSPIIFYQLFVFYCTWRQPGLSTGFIDKLKQAQGAYQSCTIGYISGLTVSLSHCLTVAFLFLVFSPLESYIRSKQSSMSFNLI